MTAESNNKGRKKMFIIISLAVLALIISVVLIINRINNPPLVASDIKEIVIHTDGSPTVYINFDKNEAEIPINDIIIPLEEEALEAYREFFIKYRKSKMKGRYTEPYLPWVNTSTSRFYWSIFITKQDDTDLKHEGSIAYPKDWSEFIAKTNELLGGEYLSDDTHGLSLS